MAVMKHFLKRMEGGSRPLTRRGALAAIGMLTVFPSVLPAAAQSPATTGASGSAVARSAQELRSERPTLLVLGDSLSAEYGLPRGAGWVQRLSERISARGFDYRIVNASISGETTAGGLTRIDGLLRRQRPTIVIIELGGNDALRGLDLSSTRSNLLGMAQRARATGARVLLLGMQMPPNYGAAYGQGFSRLFTEVARETDAALVPFFLEDIGDRFEYFQTDRIHPNESAQPLMMERVWPALEPLLAATAQPR